MPPENSRVLAAQLPNARLIEYPGAAHGYLVEIETTADDLLDFLAEVDAAQNSAS